MTQMRSWALVGMGEERIPQVGKVSAMGVTEWYALSVERTRSIRSVSSGAPEPLCLHAKTPVTMFDDGLKTGRPTRLGIFVRAKSRYGAYLDETSGLGVRLGFLAPSTNKHVGRNDVDLCEGHEMEI